MANQKFYTIIVGRKEPATVLQGQLSKSSGLPQGQTQKVKLPVGAYMVPNYSRVWAKRVIKDGKKDTRVSVTDTKYTGQLEFLKWGDEGGEVVEVRYLPNAQTLDKLYQDTVLKIRPSDENAYITFGQGLNNFDEVTQPLLAQMVKVHTMNANSESRDPNNTDWDYINYDPKARNKSKFEEIAVKNTAEGYVLNARDDKGKTRILATIFNIDQQLQDDVILEQLLEKATTLPNKFVHAVDSFQKEVRIVLEDAMREDVMVIEPDGKLYLTENGKREVIFDGVEGKGADRFSFISSNILDDVTLFDAVKRVDKAYKYLQKQLA